MSWIKEKLLNVLKTSELQAGLSMTANAVSAASPAVGAIVGAFKEVASIADEAKGRYILKGLSTGCNQEKFINELETYVNSSDENANYVANTLRKALLADSPIACVLMGKILADHIMGNKAFDQYDVMIVHALESATDDDLREFKNMMLHYENKYIIITSQETADWCYMNRLFRQIIGNVLEQENNLSLMPVYIPTEAANKLMKYLDEIKQCYRESLL